jgi:hypothetical protein
LSPSFIIEEKTLKNKDELGSSLSSSTIEEKQPRTTRSWDFSLSLSFTTEEKKLRDGDEPFGLSSSFVA